MTIDDLCAEAAELLTTKEVHPELFRVLEKKGYSPWMHEVASTERMTVHMPPAYLFARASCGKTARSFLSVFAQWSERLAASDKSIEVMANGEWPALLSWMETKAFDEASSHLDDYRLARLLSCEIRKGIAETDRPFAREWPGRSADFWARLGAEACIRGTSKSCVWARKWAEKAFSEFEAASSSLKRGASGESGRFALAAALAGWEDLAVKIGGSSKEARRFVSPQGLRRLTQKMVLARATGLKVALLNETGVRVDLHSTVDKLFEYLPFVAALSQAEKSGDFKSLPSLVLQVSHGAYSKDSLSLKIPCARYSSGIERAQRRAEKGERFQWSDRRLVPPMFLLVAGGASPKEVASLTGASARDVERTMELLSFSLASGRKMSAQETADMEEMVLGAATENGARRKNLARI